MQVLNIHQRVIHQPKQSIVALIQTLSAQDDKVWPYEKWVRMKLDKGLKVGSKGGHGPIRYFVNRLVSEELVEFEFTFPKGFKGVHRFEIKALDEERTEVRHVIDAKIIGTDRLLWGLAIRWLHDALAEDALDKVENQFDDKNRNTKWSLWVKICRNFLTPKKK